jgi:hypothetical protein
MTVFCRSESGSPGRLAPFTFPSPENQRSQGIGDRNRNFTPRVRLASQRLSAPLTCSFTSQSGQASSSLQRFEAVKR